MFQNRNVAFFEGRQTDLLGRERSTLPWSYKSSPEAYETLDSSHTPFAPITVTTAPKKWIVQLADSPRDACEGNRDLFCFFARRHRSDPVRYSILHKMNR
jgi:hypothetical protein